MRKPGQRRFKQETWAMPPEEAKAVIDRLTAFMAEKAIGLDAVAKKAQCEVSHLEACIAGKRCLTLTQVIMASEAVKVHPRKLFGMPMKFPQGIRGPDGRNGYE